MVTFVPMFVSPACREWELDADRRGASGAAWTTANLTVPRRHSADWARQHPMPRATLRRRRRPPRPHARGGGRRPPRHRRRLRRHQRAAGRPDRRVLLPGAVRRAARPGLDRGRLRQAGQRQHPAGRCARRGRRSRRSSPAETWSAQRGLRARLHLAVQEDARPARCRSRPGRRSSGSPAAASGRSTPHPCARPPSPGVVSTDQYAAVPLYGHWVLRSRRPQQVHPARR